MNFPFATMENLLFLGVPILKHIRILSVNIIAIILLESNSSFGGKCRTVPAIMQWSFKPVYTIIVLERLSPAQ